MDHDDTYEEALERLTEAVDENSISEDEYNGVTVGIDFLSGLHK